MAAGDKQDALLYVVPASERLVRLAENPLEGGTQLAARGYALILRTAVREEPMPCVTDLFRDMFESAAAEPSWMALWLISRVETSVNEAKHLLSLAAAAEDAAQQGLLEKCANRRSHAAGRYLNLVDLVFPGAVAPDFRSQLVSLHRSFVSPSLSLRGRRGDSIHLLAAANLAELRHAFIQLLLRKTIIHHCVPKRRYAVSRLIQLMSNASANNIGRTARAIDERLVHWPANEAKVVFRNAIIQLNRRAAEEFVEYSYNRRFGLYP